MVDVEEYTLTDRQTKIRDGIADRIVFLVGGGKERFRAIRRLVSARLWLYPIQVEETIRKTAYENAMTRLGEMGVSAVVYGRQADTIGEAAVIEPDVIVRSMEKNTVPNVPDRSSVFLTLVRAHTPDLAIVNGTIAKVPA